MKKKDLINKLRNEIPRLPITFYNLKQIPLDSKRFLKIKTKENIQGYIASQIVEKPYKPISKLL
jgi:hypothetical protein